MVLEIAGWRRYILVQPPIMILLFAQSMSGNILTDLLIYRTCTVTLGLNKSECLVLHENSTSAEALRLNVQVQPLVSLIIMSKSLVESILPSLISLFLGPWSDKYGRKPLLLSGYLGVSTTFLLLSIMSNIDVSPWFLLIAYIPSACLGGFCILLLASICYIADISDEDNRSWHLAWFEALISVGILFGIFLGPVIYKIYGYTIVFSVTTLCCTLASLYVWHFVPETIHRSGSTSLMSLFDLTLVKDVVSSCVKKREGFDRCTVWCCILCLCLNAINLQGDITIGYLFANARLGWNVQEYSNYMGCNMILSIIGTIVGMKILRNFAECPEPIVSIISVTSSLSGSLVLAFTWKPWHMYLCAAVGMLGGITGPATRAILSKAVPSQDAGKVFSLTTSIETLTPFGSASLFNLVYDYYMPPWYPAPVWLVSVGIFSIMIILLLNIQLQSMRYTIIPYREHSSN